MGYDISWGLRHDRSLTKAELDTLRGHVTSWASKIAGYRMSALRSDLVPKEGWVAVGSLRPVGAKGGYNVDVLDDMFEAMAELRGLIANTELVFGDDFQGYEWVGGGWGPGSDEWDLPPSPDGNWQAIEPAAARHVRATDDDDDDEDDDDDDFDEDDESSSRPRDLYLLDGPALQKVFDDANEPEQERWKAFDQIMALADQHSRLALQLVARERDRQPAVVARALKAFTSGEIRPLPTVLLAIDRGTPNTTAVWARLKSVDVDRVLPWLPATPGGRALGWLGAGTIDGNIRFLRERGGDLLDDVFASWCEADQTYMRERYGSGQSLFGDFDEFACAPIAAALAKFFTAFTAFEREHGNIVDRASDSAKQLVKYLGDDTIRWPQPQKKPEIKFAMRDLMIAVAIAVGAEEQQPFLSDYARKELLAYEITQSVPKPAEIERGLEGAPNALGNVAPKA